MVGLPQYSECFETFPAKLCLKVRESPSFIMDYELEEEEIPPWQNTLNRALERIEQLEAALHTER